MATLLISGCVTTSLPLCPKLAKLSYVDEHNFGSSKYLNRYILENTERLGIEVNVLSPFIAEFKGTKKSISWLRNNYSQMVCAFDPEQVLNDKGFHVSCTANAAEWIRIIDESLIPQLLDDQYVFGDTCVK